MARLPGLEEAHVEQPVRVGGDLAACIDDAGRADELPRIDGVHAVVRMVLAGDPVHRGVEVRAGVLAAGKIVPVPARSLVVVLADALLLEGPDLAELRRQHQRGEVAGQGLRQVDDAQRAAGDVLGELLK
jgi:hypothetical protein